LKLQCTLRWNQAGVLQPSRRSDHSECFLVYTGAIDILLQVVTAHAVKVSVTEHLNADVSGYLPAHCIYHLLRSRTFTKHQVVVGLPVTVKKTRI